MALNSVIDEAKEALFKSKFAVTSAEKAVISAKYALASSETALASAKTANFQIQKILAAAALAQDLENTTFELGDCNNKYGTDAISPDQTRLDTLYGGLSESFYPFASLSTPGPCEPTLYHSAIRDSSAIFHQVKNEEDQIDVKTYPDGFGHTNVADEADENGNIEDASYAEICRNIPLPDSPCTPVVGRPPNFSVLSTSTPLHHCYGNTDCPSGQKIKTCGSKVKMLTRCNRT